MLAYFSSGFNISFTSLHMCRSKYAELNYWVISYYLHPQLYLYIQVEEEELHSQIAALNTQLESLTAKFDEKDRELVAQERQIKEMKNMNAALENQLTEYVDALKHQKKVSTP